MSAKEQIKYSIAVASFAAAVVFGAAGMWLNAEHVPAGGTLTLVAQFLLLTASIFGIDYTFRKPS